MNANNRFMNYTIANIRVSLPDACTGEHFTRALRPFLTLGAGPADLALEIVPRIPAEADYRELDIFEFPDADADCRFGTDAAGYLLEMTPRDGSAPARYRMAYGAAAARSDITPPDTIPRCSGSGSGSFSTSRRCPSEPWPSTPR